MIFYQILVSPIGPLLVFGDGEYLHGLYMDASSIQPEWIREETAILKRTREQLRAYFAKELTDFDLPLEPRGTAFQQKVWALLCEIPYGQTISYGELARRVGNPSASRAVGLANGQNPISIVIPCHRVVGAGGNLVGYGGGLERKRWLLDLEASTLFST